MLPRLRHAPLIHIIRRFRRHKLFIAMRPLLLPPLHYADADTLLMLRTPRERASFR